jgi:hypothetical protein
MERNSPYALYSYADWLDRILWWTIRLAAVLFLLCVAGTALIARFEIFTWGMILGIFVWPAAWILR